MTIQSRCTDETGEVQPTVEEMAKVWGATKEEWIENFRNPPNTLGWWVTPSLFNAIQPWRINRDGTIDNTMLV